MPSLGCRAAVLLLLGCGFGHGAAAAQRTLDFQDFQVDLAVRRDGSLLVTETIRVHFAGSW